MFKKYSYLIILIATFSCASNFNYYEKVGFAKVSKSNDIISILPKGTLIKISNFENKQSLTIRTTKQDDKLNSRLVVLPLNVYNEISLDKNFPLIQVLSVKDNKSFTAKNVKIYKEEKTGPQLEDSKVVISAGRGMVDKENLVIVEELAAKLNAAIGGTRAIVDAGWMPYSQQVGQTGKTVKPDVYIACGISGATQHQVGMKDSKFIIAINKDEEAPIFQLADLGIVGDTLSVIPKINQNL